MKITVIMEDDEKRVTITVPEVVDFQVGHTFGEPTFQRNPFRVTRPPRLERLTFDLEPIMQLDKSYYSHEVEELKKENTDGNSGRQEGGEGAEEGREAPDHPREGSEAAD